MRAWAYPGSTGRTRDAVAWVALVWRPRSPLGSGTAASGVPVPGLVWVLRGVQVMRVDGTPYPQAAAATPDVSAHPCSQKLLLPPHLDACPWEPEGADHPRSIQTCPPNYTAAAHRSARPTPATRQTRA